MMWMKHDETMTFSPDALGLKGSDWAFLSTRRTVDHRPSTLDHVDHQQMKLGHLKGWYVDGVTRSVFPD